MTPRFVLDAWALLALLQGEEPAASRVRQLLEQAQAARVELFMAIINLGEVIYRVGRVRGEAEAWETLEQICHLPLTVVPVADDAVWAAVGLKMRYAISYADAFAVATANALRATLATGDPELKLLEDRVQLEVLRRGGVS